MAMRGRSRAAMIAFTEMRCRAGRCRIDALRPGRRAALVRIGPSSKVSRTIPVWQVTCSRGRTLDEEIVLCSALGFRGVRITFKVTFCSDYTDKRSPSYMEMMQEAWILHPGTKRRPAGFVRGRDLHDDELFDEPPPGPRPKRKQPG